MGNERRSEEIPSTSSGAGFERSSSPSFIADDPYVVEEGQQLFPSAQRLGDMGKGTQNTIPIGMAQESAPPDDGISMGGVPYTPSKFYHTLILKNYAKVPTAINCLYVEHDDHLHVLIQARDNVCRKITRLLNDCMVPADEWWIAKATRQYVRNVFQIIQYFKHRGVVKKVGQELEEEWERSLCLPPLEPQSAYYSELKCAKTKSLVAQRAETRQAKFDSLLEELVRRDIRQFEDIFQKFSVQEITKMNSSMGVQWREIAKQQIQSLNAERLQLEQSSSYLENLRNLKHECATKTSKDVEVGTNWLMMLLNQNNINIGDLLQDIVNIMDKKQPR